MKTCYWKSTLLLSSIFIALIFKSTAQCPVADFTIASPVCAGSALNITNISTNSTSYEWDFSPGYLSQSASRLSDTSLSLSYPGDITSITQNDTLITFISGKGDGKVYRAIYGNGPQNPLTQLDDLGNLGGTTYQPSDVTLYQENFEWYGLVVDYGSNSLIRFHLGNSLINTPDNFVVLLNNGNSNFNSPWSIKIAKDGSGNIHGLVANFLAGTITYLNFGNSILNVPVPSAPVTVSGTTYVLDLVIAHDCGNWYAFIAGYNSSNIIKADFGNSLSNAPTFTTIISNGSPSDIAIINDSSQWKILYTNYNSHEIMRYNLGSNLASITPVYLGSDYFGGSSPKGITAVRMGSSVIVSAFYTGSNSLQVLKYQNAAIVNTYTSTSPAPSNIMFGGGGSYPVTLKAFDAQGNFSTKTILISIVAGPTAAFSVQNLCLGDQTNFTDASTVPSGNISSWKWDFGDGDTSISQYPTHTYASSGTYPLTLTTVSNFGCTNSTSGSLDITPHPVAAFSAPPATCSLTNLQFNDQSTVSSGSIASWLWRFGTGDTSVNQNPVYSFPYDGNLPVSLVVTTAAGCSDSTMSYLTVNDRPVAKFLTENTCINQNVLFTDQTTLNGSSISSYEWEFGDGNTGNIANPTHLYPALVAPYSVRLIVTALNGCRDTSDQSIKINNIPTVNFSYLPAAVCQNNDVLFSDLSSVVGDTISKWAWDFGDGNIDSASNPIHRYTQPGLYPVSFISYSPSSCPGVVLQQILDVKESPVASFATSTTCFGTSTHFTNNSLPATGSSIDSVLWRFSATDSSGIYSPDYLFSTSGTKTVSLTVISSEGCKSEYNNSLIVHQLPIASFTNGNICSGTPVQFTNSSSCDGASILSQYDWNFGDFASGGLNNSTQRNPSHTFSMVLNYNVTLIVTTDYGCKDTVIKTLNVNQTPPAQFTYSPTCYGSLMEFFNPGSSLDSAYSWSFGDNQSNQLKEPAHFYAFPGTYTVTLNVTSSSGCISSASKQVTVSPIPAANFIATPACVNTNYQLIDNSSILSGSINKWNWRITGLTAPDSIKNPVYLFSDTGNYSVVLTVTSDIGCTKSITKTIGVHNLPIANFSSDPQFGNPPLDIQTIDYSTGGSYYTWNFGDGTDTVTLHEPTHTYMDTGMFSITQVVTSIYGCSAQFSKNIYVIKPILDIAVTGDSSYFDDKYFHIVARIANLGTRSINNLKMQAELQNGSTVSEESQTTIPNGQNGIQTFYFRSSFLNDPSNPFKYYCIKAVLANGEKDDFPSNNERCINLTDQLVGLEIYPNPCFEEMTIKLVPPFSDQLSVEMFDHSGKKIATLFEGMTPKGMKDLHYNMDGLAEGVYRLSIRFGEAVYSRQVIHFKRKN